MRIFLAAALLVSALIAAERLSIDQAIDLREPQDLQFSPDGRLVALTVKEPPSTTKTAQRHIWVYDTGSHELRQWTNSPKSESSPRWSPDGKTLAFLSDRGEGNQIWLLPVNGGEALELTSAKNAVESFRWSPDGKRIAFLAPDPRTAEAQPGHNRGQPDPLRFPKTQRCLRDIICASDRVVADGRQNSQKHAQIRLSPVPPGSKRAIG